MDTNQYANSVFDESTGRSHGYIMPPEPHQSSFGFGVGKDYVEAPLFVPESPRYATLGTDRLDEFHHSRLPPLLPLPRHDDVHEGWEATDVPTAKCDMCHRQRCGTIQKCVECKLSICKPCALAGRLEDDTRHILLSDSVDWSAPSPSLGRERKRSRSARSRRSREAPTSDVRDDLYESGRMRTRPRNAPSRDMPVPYANAAEPTTGAAHLNVGNQWNDGYSCQDKQHHMSETAIANCHQPLGRSVDTLSSYSRQAAEVADVAEILVAMPGRGRNNHVHEANHAHGIHQPNTANNVFLPPVRSVLESRQENDLPSLKTLHPHLGSNDTQFQPTYQKGYVLPHPSSSSYAAHHFHTDNSAGLASYNPFPAQGDLPFCKPVHQWNPYATPVSSNYNLYGELAHQSTYAATYDHLQGTQCVPRTSNTPGSILDYPQGTYNSGRNGHVLDCSNTANALRIEHQATAPSGAKSIPYIADPASQTSRKAHPTTQERGAELIASARAIQSSEHPEWALELCLQVALSRGWSSMLAQNPHANRMAAFKEFRASAYFAALSLGLPDRRNAARDWICEQEAALIQ